MKWRLDELDVFLSLLVVFFNCGAEFYIEGDTSGRAREKKRRMCVFLVCAVVA